MHQEQPSNNQPVLPPQPALPNFFSLFTRAVIELLLIAAFRAIFLYFIWNLALAQELHLPQLSYLFFFCGFLFLQNLIYSPQHGQMLFQLQDINRSLLQLVNIERWNMTMDMLNPKQPTDQKDILVENNKKDA